jgi:predicted nucleic acid-binding protein
VGTLTLPASGSIYLDANGFIYSIERVAPYYPVLDTFWQDIRMQGLSVLTSELTLLETLVKPIRNGDQVLETAFRTVLLTSPDVQLAPIARDIVERATHIRAIAGLKTPDAIHAATALELGCGLFLTNDAAFRRVSGLIVTVLSDLLMP